MSTTAHTKPLTFLQKTARDRKLIEARKKKVDNYLKLQDSGRDTTALRRELFGGSRQAGSKYFRSRITICVACFS